MTYFVTEQFDWSWISIRIAVTCYSACLLDNLTLSPPEYFTGEVLGFLRNAFKPVLIWVIPENIHTEISSLWGVWIFSVITHCFETCISGTDFLGGCGGLRTPPQKWFAPPKGIWHSRTKIWKSVSDVFGHLYHWLPVNDNVLPKISNCAVF